MISRFNYELSKRSPEKLGEFFYKWTYEERIKVLSTNKDGSVSNYVKEHYWKKEKCSWIDFINSYDIGSVSEQVLNHLEKGTPLVTAHTLPAGDYTQLEKGAEIKREMAEKGITLDMLVQAFNEANKQSSVVEEKKVEVSE